MMFRQTLIISMKVDTFFSRQYFVNMRFDWLFYTAIIHHMRSAYNVQTRLHTNIKIIYTHMYIVQNSATDDCRVWRTSRQYSRRHNMVYRGPGQFFIARSWRQWLEKSSPDRKPIWYRLTTAYLPLLAGSLQSWRIFSDSRLPRNSAS